MNHYEQYLGYEGFNKLTVADLKHGDRVLSLVAVKLQTMPPDHFRTRALEARVRFLMDLLRESFANRYPALSVSAFAHILVALDYFLRVKDLQPDTLPDGYSDDLKLMDELFERFNTEFKSFKEWQARQPAR